MVHVTMVTLMAMPALLRMIATVAAMLVGVIVRVFGMMAMTVVEVPGYVRRG